MTRISRRVPPIRASSSVAAAVRVSLRLWSRRFTARNSKKQVYFSKEEWPKIPYRICRNKCPGRLIFRDNKKIFQNPSKAIGFVYFLLWKTSPSKSHRFHVLPPLKNHPNKPHRFCVLPPLKNHCFWWALISGWAFILANTVFHSKRGKKQCETHCCLTLQQCRASRQSVPQLLTLPCQPKKKK